MNNKIQWLGWLYGLGICCASAASGQTSASQNFQIRSTFATGGGSQESTQFSSNTIVGQPVSLAAAQNESFSLDGGFVNYEIEIQIDIQSGETPNSLNLRKRNGAVPVAILTTDTFNAALIDTRIDDDGKAKISFAGATADTHKGQLVIGFEDVDFDADLDLVVRFPARDIDPSLLTSVGAEQYAELRAISIGGTPVWGRDTVTIIY